MNIISKIFHKRDNKNAINKWLDYIENKVGAKCSDSLSANPTKVANKIINQKTLTPKTKAFLTSQTFGTYYRDTFMNQAAYIAVDEVYEILESMPSGEEQDALRQSAIEKNAYYLACVTLNDYTKLIKKITKLPNYDRELGVGDLATQLYNSSKEFLNERKELVQMANLSEDISPERMEQHQKNVMDVVKEFTKCFPSMKNAENSAPSL